MTVVNEARATVSPRPSQNATGAASAVQMRSVLRGADLDVQMSLLEPAQRRASDGAGGAGATSRAASDAVQLTPAADQAAAGQAGSGQAAAAEPTVSVQSGVVVSEGMIATLKKILKAAKLKSATVTSGARSSAQQAEAMYTNIVAKGVASQLALYAAPGDQVVRVYQAEKRAGKNAAQIKAAMRDKIVELGPSNVSKHCSDTHDTIDVSAGSIADKAAFKTALAQALTDGDISKFIPPGGGEPAFHIEKPK